MTEAHAHTPFHPRWLRRHVSTYWWLQSRSYFLFILREASCLFVAWTVVFILLLVRAVAQGPASYQAFLEWSAARPILLLNIVGIAFLVLHAITFFDAAPRALVVHMGRKRVPGSLIAASHYAAWAAASVATFWAFTVWGR